MNLADYLSDLLGQRDEVSVPGLGNFMRTRVNAAYNEAEGRFYPPYHQVAFVPKPKDDEIFAQYVADEKNISLASSKYFVEKFVNKLREDAATGKYLFADLGSFQSNGGDQLIFKPNERIPADPAFYGYSPVDIFKIGQPLSVDSRKPVFEHVQEPVVAEQPPVAAAPPVIPTPRQIVQQPDYYEDEVETKKGISAWVIILIAVAVIAIGVFALLKFYPSVFDSVSDEYHKLMDKPVPAVIRKEVKKDTIKKVIRVVDTSKTATVAKKDTTPAPLPSRFEAIVFKTNNMRSAEIEMKRLKALGYDAYLVTDAPGLGPLLKISVNSYTTYSAADSVSNSLLKAGVIKKHYYPLEIKSK
jgi:hypothetical protein